jgi:hypothetical protein
MRIRRQNVTWLAILGVLVAIAVLANVATGLQVGALLALYAVALAASLLEVRPAKIIGDVQRSSLARMRMSPQAQEATERASRRGSVGVSGITMLDIGLIVSHTTSEGMVMRRSRAFSKDDDGVRPYLTLQVHPHAADTTSIIRFEMVDHNGRQQYVHEMKTYLRDGEMNILADHQLPLGRNERLEGSGDGDLRVYMDGALLGALNYTLAPSVRERNRQISRMQQMEDEIIDDESLDAPMSLEDLLRSRDARSR